MSEEHSKQAAATSNQGSRFRWPHAVAAIALVCALALITCFTMALKSCEKAVANPIDRLQEAFHPSVSATTILNTTVTGISRKTKLVVFTVEITSEVTQEEESRWCYGIIYLGTTKVRIRASGNRGQYYIPTGDITVDRFEYDEGRGVLTFRVPHPVFDEEVVDVQSDPSKIEIETSVGWSSLDSFEGEEVRQKAKSKLRQAVIAEGRREIYQAAVRENARKGVLDFLEPLAKSLKDNVRLAVEFDKPPVEKSTSVK